MIEGSMLARRAITINSSSLTFGFAFMGILLVMLISASLLQRYIAARERAERLRLGLALDGLAALYGPEDENEGRPEMWEVHVKPNEESAGGRWSGDSDEMSRGKGTIGESYCAHKWRWKDIQPLAAQTIAMPSSSLNSPSSKPPSSESNTPTCDNLTIELSSPPPYSTYISMFIAMPISPSVREAQARDGDQSRARSSRDEKGENEQRGFAAISDDIGLQGLYYEIGIMEILKR